MPKPFRLAAFAALLLAAPALAAPTCLPRHEVEWRAAVAARLFELHAREAGLDRLIAQARGRPGEAGRVADYRRELGFLAAEAAHDEAVFALLKDIRPCHE
jgi:hypothetical protein